MKIRALEDVVFLEPLTVAGPESVIQLPSAHHNDRHYGKLVAIGYKRLRNGEKISCLEGAIVGDTVRYSRAGMWEGTFNGKLLVFGKPGYCVAVIFGKVEARLESHSMREFV